MTDRPRPIDSLTPLGRMAQAMNFWRIHESPPVFVTMDHRAVLVAAWAAQRQGLFAAGPPVLLRLDAHPDCGEPPRPWAWEASHLTDFDAVHAVVNATRCDDGGWLNAAMQFGFASDVTTLFVHDYHRFPGDCGPYTDHRGETHQVLFYESAKEFLSDNRPRAVKIRTTISERAPLWLDLDLDFATRRGENDAPVLWTDADWADAFDASTTAFLAAAFSRASLVTIATEPEFCGGHAALGKIVEKLKALMAPHGKWLEKL